jgi:hypothetical protein
MALTVCPCRTAIKCLLFVICLASPSLNESLAQVQWRRYSLPANLEISIPDDWLAPTPAEQTQLNLEARKLVEGLPTSRTRMTSRSVLNLSDFNASGVLIANIKVSEISSDDSNDRLAMSQEAMALMVNDTDAAAKTVTTIDTEARTSTETEMAYIGVPVNWLGTEIAQVGELRAFVSRFEWTLLMTAGPSKKEEVFSVVEAKIFNNGQLCVIRMEHSKNFPEMVPLTDSILRTVRTR